MSRAILWPREHELEQVRPGVDEAAAAVEGRRPAVVARDDDLERERLLRDGEALRVLEELPADALGLVLGAHEELVDANRVARPLERDVARGRALQVGHEHGLPLENGERAPVGAAVEAG